MDLPAVGSRRSALQSLSRVIHHGGQRRMSDPAFERDREELSLDPLSLADGLERIAVTKLCGENGGNGRDAVTRPRKLTQQRVVLEFPNNYRSRIAPVQPLVKRSPHGSSVGWQEDRGAVQGLREATPQLFRQRLRPHPQHLAPAEWVIVRTDI